MFRFVVAIGCVLLALSAEVPTQAADFTLKAETVEALEGGPVVLHVTLTYQGKEPVAVSVNCLTGSIVYVSAPKSWKLIEGDITIESARGLMEKTIKQVDACGKVEEEENRVRRFPRQPLLCRACYYAHFSTATMNKCLCSQSKHLSKSCWLGVA